ncbi:hypothetical protein [Desulfosporosinus sp. FKA]|uniref:hypothetical protein n=1 Tax=Desulfosporosinus sp. FKA TaxID=1969834 RepID=UPI00155458C6|nr:hypothetical protein [Desulfosporosinus sp. FKA]
MYRMGYGVYGMGGAVGEGGSCIGAGIIAIAILILIALGVISKFNRLSSIQGDSRLNI